MSTMRGIDTLGSRGDHCTISRVHGYDRRMYGAGLCSGRYPLHGIGAIVLAACAASDPAGADTSGTTSSETSDGTGASEADTSGPSPETSTTPGTTEGDDGTASTEGDGTTGGFPAPIPDDCIDDVAAGAHVYACDDLTFDVEIPAACLQEACGLIVDVHGFTMSGQMQDANTNMRALGSERGYIVMQPNATPAPPGASWTPGVDDDKVFAFMMRLATAFHVDDRRLHFTGFSQGGAMSWRFACAHSDVLASVAPAAACSDGGGVLQDCAFMGDEVPAEPLPILYMHGTTDALVAFDCAPPRRDAVVAAFGLGEEQVVAEDEGHRWTRHEGRDRGLLEFIEHDYAAASPLLGGHCYPGSDDPGDAPGQLFPFKCEDESAFVWGEVAIDFFDAHPRP
jgi:hypothetical protein